LAASNGEARRLIKGGGAKVNDAPVTNETEVIGSAHLVDGAMKLTAGKKRHSLVKAE
jgi:tyrosyl-tRNA synthetase